MTFSALVQTIVSVVPQGLLGSLVLVVFAGLGWREGRRPLRWTVRAVGWWLGHVVRPLLTCRSWSRRALTIAANNASVCAALTALGWLGHAAWIGVAGVGFSLGIGLRMLATSLNDGLPAGEQITGARRVIGTVGVALNMLEPPAILLSVGLGLAQGAIPADVHGRDVWGAFAAVVLPLLVLAAAGEALWMGIWPPVPTSESEPIGEP